MQCNISTVHYLFMANRISVYMCNVVSL